MGNGHTDRPRSGVLSLNSSEFLICGMERVTREQSFSVILLIIALFKIVKILETTYVPNNGRLVQRVMEKANEGKLGSHWK